MQDVLETTPFLQYLPLLAAGAFILMGIFSLVAVWRDWSLAITLYEAGIEYTDRRGTRRITWNEVAGLQVQINRYTYYFIIPAGTTYQATLQLHAGGVLLFDGRFSKVKQFCDGLQVRLAAVQLPEHLSQVRAGNRLEFGTLSLDKTNLYYQDKALAWAEVERVTLTERAISIAKQGKKWGQ